MPKKLPPPWQQVDTRVIFQHPRLTVWEDTVVLPTGEQTQWMHFREAPDFVKVVCVNDRRQVLLVYSYAYPPRQVVHEFPGGVVNPGEAPTDAARRELVEEVGLYPLHLRAVGTFLDNTRRSDRRCTLFYASDFETRPARPDLEEFIEHDWLEIPAVEEMIRNDEIQNVTLLAAWSLFRLKCAEIL
jgi:ADP-ribose pyrophosphatase